MWVATQNGSLCKDQYSDIKPVAEGLWKQTPLVLNAAADGTPSQRHKHMKINAGGVTWLSPPAYVATGFNKVATCRKHEPRMRQAQLE